MALRFLSHLRNALAEHRTKRDLPNTKPGAPPFLLLAKDLNQFGMPAELKEHKFQSSRGEEAISTEFSLVVGIG